MTIVAIKCMGHIDGPRYLDGRTGDGTVGLAPSIEGYSGTQWELESDGVYVTFKCMGHIDGPRYLDGRTGDGTVGLAHSTEGFSGTTWSNLSINGYVVLKCMGHIEGPRYLDGRTGDGTVGLVNDHSTPELSGTRWEVISLVSDDSSEFGYRQMGATV